jgi:hypothetical protein
MSANLSGFNANTVEPSMEFDAIPSGKYVACIVESEMKPTKSGTGSYLQLTFEVLEGEFKGRKVWSRLNLENPNAVAVQMARSELSSICRAVGVLEPKDSVELHNLPLVITVKQKTNEGEVFNEVRGYSNKDAATSPKPQQATTSTPPWRR